MNGVARAEEVRNVVRRRGVRRMARLGASRLGTGLERGRERAVQCDS